MYQKNSQNSGNAIRSLDQLTQEELFACVADICNAVNKITNTRELLELSLKKTMELFGAQRGSIFILNENGKDLILKIAQGMEISEEENMVKRMGEGVVGRVAASKKPIFVNDIGRDERFQDYKPRKSYLTPSFICAPLLVKDKLIGVINITDKGCGSSFKQNELQLLDFLSTQIALNYRRVQLYEKFKTIVRESKTLKDELGKSSQEARHLKKQIVLNEKLASIGKLAGGIAHEFNNPLDGVMRYTNLCLEHATEDEVLNGYLMEIKHGLKRMANIVRSLLACSRNANPRNDRVDLNRAAEQAVHSLQMDIENKNVSLKKELQSNLPEVRDLGLELILTNLIRNAIDAVESGGRVGVKTQQEGGRLILEISDNGCGIEADKFETIFEPFYTTKDIEKGCGLGLTIVSEIVKSYNGQINVESELKKGTTVSIAIPL